MIRPLMPAVTVQAICDGKILATVLSDSEGHYRLPNVKPGGCLIRCHVTGGYIYYGEGNVSSTDESDAVPVLVKQGKTLSNIDFRFAPFKERCVETLRPIGWISIRHSDEDLCGF